MLTVYAIYLLGPVLIALLVARMLRHGSGWSFLLGYPAFLAAWLGTMTTFTIAMSLWPPNEQPLLIAIVISISAGVFEESARYLSFRFLPVLCRRRDWPNGLLYTAGHSGMESAIVAGSLILTVLVVTHAPEILSPDVLESSRATVDVPFLRQLYGSIERVIVGFVIHAAFTCVVLLSFRKGMRFLALAMLWHFAHDMVAFNLGRVSTHWIAHALWIGFILVVYSYVIWRCRHLLRPASAGRSAEQEAEEMGAVGVVEERPVGEAVEEPGRDD